MLDCPTWKSKFKTTLLLVQKFNRSPYASFDMRQCSFAVKGSTALKRHVQKTAQFMQLRTPTVYPAQSAPDSTNTEIGWLGTV